MSTHMSTHMCLCTCPCTCPHTFLHVSLYVCLHDYLGTWLGTCPFICLHTCLHIFLHTTLHTNVTSFIPDSFTASSNRFFLLGSINYVFFAGIDQSCFFLLVHYCLGCFAFCARETVCRGISFARSCGLWKCANSQPCQLHTPFPRGRDRTPWVRSTPIERCHLRSRYAPVEVGIKWKRSGAHACWKQMASKTGDACRETSMWQRVREQTWPAVEGVHTYAHMLSSLA